MFARRGVMAKTILSYVTAATVCLATTAQVSAGGGYPVECYERYRTAPVYDTLTENVQVNPGYTHVEVTPPIYGVRTREVLMKPGRIKYRTMPALYSYEKERVLVEPARTVKRLVPAVTETRYKKVRVSGSGYTWEWRVINGRKVLCKIKRKARYEHVAYSVEIAPARYVHQKAPARYAYQKRRVLVEPERTESYVLAPEYETVRQQVMIQPKQVRHYEVAPSYRTRSRQVLVSEGTEGWRQVRIPRHCKR
jgi:hypothetical protein